MTLDALHAKRETAQALSEQGADYVLALKANQGTLCEEVRTLLENAGLPIRDQAQTVEADHGRIETREARLTTDLIWL